MTDQVCPFCGAGLIDTSNDTFPAIVYECFSHGNSSQGTKQCFKRQISQLKAGIGEALEVIPGLLEIIKNCRALVKASIHGIQCSNEEADAADSIKAKAAALILKLRALKGEG